MRKFEIKALYVGGLSNLIFKSGDIVDESAFEADNIERLIEGDYISPIVESEATAVASKEDNEENEKPLDEPVKEDTAVASKESGEVVKKKTTKK